MWRKAACAGAGLIAACATAYFVPTSGGISTARSASFEARWAAPELAPKQDRLAPPQPAGPSFVFSFNVPGANTTVITKSNFMPQVRNNPPPRPAVSPVREIPHGSKRQEKLPVGCEPSFSPVAVPAMAHVGGRCLS